MSFNLQLSKSSFLDTINIFQWACVCLLPSITHYSEDYRITLTFQKETKKTMLAKTVALSAPMCNNKGVRNCLHCALFPPKFCYLYLIIICPSFPNHWRLLLNYFSQRRQKCLFFFNSAQSPGYVQGESKKSGISKNFKLL